MTAGAADTALRRIAADVVLSDWRGRSFARATAYWLVTLIVAGAVTRYAREPVVMPADAHAALTLDLAANAAFCGTTGHLSHVSGPTRVVSLRPQLIDLPLRDVLTHEFGSIEKYCATLNTAYIHNENGVLLLERFALALRPDASAAWLGRTLSAVRLLIVLLCGLVFLWSGASIALVAAFVVVADVVLNRVGMAFSLYPFLTVLPTVATAFYAGVLRLVPEWRPSRIAVAGLAAGLLTAAGVNVRSSYLPILVALFAAWLAAVLFKHDARVAPRSRLVGSALATFAVAFIGYHLTVIRPLLPPPGATSQNSSYHSIAHALLLGVATPVNPFAERLGIEWNDDIGATLAHQIDPSVSYLGPGYERALFTFYFRLWRQYPADMLALYEFKVRWTGRDILLAIDRLPLPLRLREDRVRRLNAVMNGYILFAIAATSLLLSAWQFVRTRSSWAFAIVGLSTAAVLILMESTIIMPTFVGMYHSYLLVFFTLAPVLALQAALDAGATIALRQRQDRLAA